jgi:hypothetical protein
MLTSIPSLRSATDLHRSGPRPGVFFVHAMGS